MTQNAQDTVAAGAYTSKEAERGRWFEQARRTKIDPYRLLD
jgi:hypothetical protein